MPVYWFCACFFHWCVVCIVHICLPVCLGFSSCSLGFYVKLKVVISQIVLSNGFDPKLSQFELKQPSAVTLSAVGLRPREVHSSVQIREVLRIWIQNRICPQSAHLCYTAASISSRPTLSDRRWRCVSAAMRAWTGWSMTTLGGIDRWTRCQPAVWSMSSQTIFVSNALLTLLTKLGS